MSEFSVLGSEPRHKVNAFAAALLEMRQQTIAEMYTALASLIGDLCTTLQQVKDSDPELELDRIRFEKTMWTKEGQLVLEISTQRDPNDESLERWFVDEFVDDLMTRSVHTEPLRAEVAQFVAAFIDQFGVLRLKNNQINLRNITFERMHWLEGRLIFDISYNGVPFSAQEARWT